MLLICFVGIWYYVTSLLTLENVASKNAIQAMPSVGEEVLEKSLLIFTLFGKNYY